MTGKRKTKKAWNVALVGAGGMGRRWAGVLKNMPGVRLHAVCDQDVSLARSAAQGARAEVFTDAAACAKCADIDIAVVVLPHNLLAQTSIHFLKQGIHVLSEKPGGISSAELRRAIAMATHHRVRYAVGYNHRFHDAYLRLQKEFARGTIGTPLFIRAKYGFGGRKGYGKEWRLDPRRSGGGELIDQGAHLIDLARLFLGDVTRVRGAFSNRFYRAKGEDNAFVLMEHAGGGISSLHASLTNWKPEHLFELYGSKGYLVVEGLGKKYGGTERLRVGIRDPKFRNPPRERIILCNDNADRSLMLEFRAFLAMIGQPQHNHLGAESALAVLRVVEEAYEEK